MAAITKNINFFKWPNCSILSQKVPKFELYKHNDELFNIYYRIFYELWTFVDFDRLCKLEKRGNEILKKSSPLKLLSQTLLKWFLGGPLPTLCPAFQNTDQKIFSSETTGPIAIKLLWNDPKLCPVIPTSNQDGRQAKNRKKGGWNYSSWNAFFVDSLLLVTQIIKGKQLYYKMWSRKS